MGKLFDLLIIVFGGGEVAAMFGVHSVAAKFHGEGIKIAAGGLAELLGGGGSGGGAGVVWSGDDDI